MKRYKKLTEEIEWEYKSDINEYQYINPSQDIIATLSFQKGTFICRYWMGNGMDRSIKKLKNADEVIKYLSDSKFPSLTEDEINKLK